MLPTVVHAVDGCVLGHWRRVCIGVWAIPGTLELVQAQEEVMRLVCEDGPRFAAVHLVIKRAPLPAAGVREAYQELARRYAPHLTSVALLIEGDGFWASAVRAFLTGVVMLDRRLRTKAFSDVAELSAWIAEAHNEEASDAIAPHELSAAIEWMLQHESVRDHRVGV